MRRSESFVSKIKKELSNRIPKQELKHIRAEGEQFAKSAVAIEIDFDSLTQAMIKEFATGVVLSAAQSAIQLSSRHALEETDVAVKSEPNYGYHLEFVFGNIQNAQAFCEVLAVFEVLPKLTLRGKDCVIYIKSSDCICNLLALVGASKNLLTLSNEVAIRQLRNLANRKANCDAANIEKQVITANMQVSAIQQIINTDGFKHLDPKLQQCALARIENPQASYEELAAILKLSKSGVVHRLNKILCRCK